MPSVFRLRPPLPRDAGIAVEPVALDDGIRLTLSAQSTFVLRLHVARSATCSVGGAFDRGWPLWRGLPVAHNHYDPFQQAVQWAAAQLHAARPARRPVAPVLRWLYAEARALAVHAADRCDPGVRRIAMRFLPHARWFVYERLLGDRTGRLAQLATTCPGALLFALALRDLGGSVETEVASERLLSGAVAGRRLHSLLDEALQSWLFAARFMGRYRDAPWKWRVREAALEDRERILRLQRLLVRRASSAVPTTLLWLPPPPAFAPEDIPRGPRGVATWFRATKPMLLQGPRLRLRPGLHKTLSAFCSRHAVALRRLALKDGLRALVDRIVDYVTATGHVLGRESSPERVVADARRWHERIAEVRELAELVRVDPRIKKKLCLEMPLAAAPYSEWFDGDTAVRPLATVGDLLDEGRRMHHCVASYVGDLVAGGAAIYSANVRGARLTVELRESGGRWALRQMKGVANRELTPLERRAIARWLALAERLTLPIRSRHPGLDILDST